MIDVRRALVWLVAVPTALAAFAAVGGVRDLSDASVSVILAAVGAGVVGLLIPPLLVMRSVARPGHGALPRWFTPLLIVGVGVVPLFSLAGRDAKALVFIGGAGFLASFASVAFVRIRERSRGDRLA
jgi:hypothetical protein